MSNRKPKSIDINPFSIAAQSKEDSNNVDSESSTEESENNLHQLKVLRLAKESLNWNPNWPKLYPWVYRKEGPLNKFMFCRWCIEAGKNNKFTNGCEYFKKQSLDRHVNISDHWIVCAARVQSQITLHSSFAIQARTDQIKLSKIQCGEDQNQFECSTEILNVFDNNQLADDDERTSYGSYQNNVSACKFIESIDRVIEQETFQELRNLDGWSLIIDESNTISAEKTLAIVSKYLIALAKPIYRFLGLILLTDSTANTIIAEINRFFQAKHISYNDLMHICTDGASTMI
ncbi:15752_t:CDS:2, partial [Racocetra persica]